MPRAAEKFLKNGVYLDKNSSEMAALPQKLSPPFGSDPLLGKIWLANFQKMAAQYFPPSFFGRHILIF